jgi:hypothetical protein
MFHSLVISNNSFHTRKYPPIYLDFSGVEFSALQFYINGFDQAVKFFFCVQPNGLRFN